VDIRGRSQTLKVNYRTSHQIRQAVDRLLPPAVRDVDRKEEERTGTVAVFNGPEPDVRILEDRVMAFGRYGRLKAILGVVPLVATALVTGIADPSIFRSGRDMSTWIGLVPKQTPPAARRAQRQRGSTISLVMLESDRLAGPHAD